MNELNTGFEEKYMWEDYIICPNCKYEGKGLLVNPGNILIEILLWLFMIIPGLIYSIWRLSNKKKICPECKNPYIKEAERKVPYVWSVFVSKIIGKVFRFLLISILCFIIFFIFYHCTRIFT